ncbi:MAG: hypothetical protein WDO56_15215 [Gammaproteobacteria bacterium]
MTSSPIARSSSRTRSPALRGGYKQARVVVLHDTAQAIVEEMRGQHPVHVFTWVNEQSVRNRVGRLRNSGWINARRRAESSYSEVIGRRESLSRVRVSGMQLRGESWWC